LILKPGAELSIDKQDSFMTLHPCITDRGAPDKPELPQQEKTDRSFNEKPLDRSFDTAIRKKEVENSYAKKYEQRLR
jgi:hypothetical protein